MNRNQRAGWTRDGDQWVFAGSLGTYRITEWHGADGSNFRISFKSKSSPNTKGIGEFSTLANAQWAAEQYDGYRNTRA